jgi:ABC-type polar amino acid transport system ATPase subunit
MIELEDVHKSFGKVEVLKGISASIAKSEVVCIIGPSGSGKSTILRCINGLESYDRGDIRSRTPASTATPARSFRSGRRYRWCSSASTCSRIARA